MADEKKTEPAKDPNFQEFPKWVEGPDGQKYLVQDAAGEKAVKADKAPSAKTDPMAKSSKKE